MITLLKYSMDIQDDYFIKLTSVWNTYHCRIICRSKAVCSQYFIYTLVYVFSHFQETLSKGPDSVTHISLHQLIVYNYSPHYIKWRRSGLSNTIVRLSNSLKYILSSQNMSYVNMNLLTVLPISTSYPRTCPSWSFFISISY